MSAENSVKNGIEEENLYEKDCDDVITEPFNPKDVDIVSQPMVISNIVEQLKYDDIILEPDFQRRPDLWGNQKQSRLIESLIIRIPLPTFYFDYSDDDKLIVVDGLQRLFAIKRFMVYKKDDPNHLELTGLEYLKEYNGKCFEELPISIQRRIKEQVITAYVIRSGTPDKVRTSIFTRINTGGLILQPAEIKNSVYRGQAANLLKKLAHTEEFVLATRNKVDSSRMLDCEFVNRFLAFYLLGLNKYYGNLEGFLNDVMIKLQKESENEMKKCEKDFLKAMKYAYGIFGDTAFRKINVNGKYGQINKPLFDAVSVNLAKRSEDECAILQDKKIQVIKNYEQLLKNPEFVKIITNGTAKINNVKSRHEKINEIFQEVLLND